MAKQKVSYTAIRKKQRGDRYVWGVLRLEGRRQQFRTVGEGPRAKKRAQALAAELQRMEVSAPEEGDRFLSWHRSGDPLPLDRTVRDHARSAKLTVAKSTATRYRQFSERLSLRLGSRDLRLLQKEDIGKFVREEQASGRAIDPTINACVLLRGAILAARRAKDATGQPHLLDDPLPSLMKIGRTTAKEAWRPELDGGPAIDAWTPAEVQTLLELAERKFPDVYGVCLFQLSTGCRLGEALGMRWSAVDLERGEVTIRLKIYRNQPGPVKTKASNRKIPIPQKLVDYLKALRERSRSSEWLFPAPRWRRTHWDDAKYQARWRKLRKEAGVRKLGTHSWRHYFISMALSSSGWTPAEVARHVGTSVKMILERYAHAIHREHGASFQFLDELEG